MKFLKYLLILGVVSCSGYSGKISQDTSYERIKITFTGLKDEFHNKGTFSVTITDKDKVERLNRLKNKCKKDYFTAHRPVIYEIDVLFTDSKNADDFVLTLISTPAKNNLVRVGYYAQYLNDDLFNYVASIIKLEEIRKYKGRLSQEKYETLIYD